MANHGKVKERKENFWITLLAQVILYVILWWGGWFDVFIAK
jgi:hypothetical protein